VKYQNGTIDLAKPNGRVLCRFDYSHHNEYLSAILFFSDAEPNTALLTAIIMFSTFILAFLLKKLKESFYLGKQLRQAIGDFGVLISIALVALTVHLCIPDPYLQRLDMPDHINYTNPTS
jgi:hypothetical protein